MLGRDGDDLEVGLDYHVEWSDPEEVEETAQKDVGTAESESVPKSNNAKKRKRRQEKLKAYKKQKTLAASESAAEAVQSVSIGASSPNLQADFVSGYQSKAFKDASSLELVSLRFPETVFINTSTYEKERRVENLEDFISTVIPVLKTRLAQRPANNGAPTLLFITSSALRATDIVRALRPTTGTKGGEVAKLFGKHCKIEEQVVYLHNKSISAGVGTGGRIGRLLKTRLSLTALTHIMIDATHQDAKQRTIFDIPETRDSLLRDVLQNDDLRQRIESGKATIVLF